MNPTRTITLPRIAAGFTLALLLCVPTQAEWYLEVGPVFRGDLEVSVQGGSDAANRGINSATSGTRGSRPAPQAVLLNDDGTAQILRVFDDGYVGPSGWEWANAEGWSQFFGYQNAEQYTAENDTLTYDLTLGGRGSSARRTRTQVTTESQGWNGRTHTDAVGIMATLGYSFRTQETFTASAQIRFGWLDGIDASFRDQSAFVQRIDRTVYEDSIQQRQTYRYSYDTLGNPAFPDAPYTMSDPAGVGPLIADTPDSITLIDDQRQSSTRQVGRSSERAVSLVDLDVDAYMFTLQLGPRFQWQANPRLGVLIQPAITANMLDATLTRNESFRQANGTTIATWSDRKSHQDWRIGMGIEAGVTAALSETWYLLLSGGYEWVDDYSFSIGPDRITMDLSGYQAQIAIGCSL